jgi:hypothetical protein
MYLFFCFTDLILAYIVKLVFINETPVKKRTSSDDVFEHLLLQDTNPVFSPHLVRKLVRLSRDNPYPQKKSKWRQIFDKLLLQLLSFIQDQDTVYRLFGLSLTYKFSN